MAERDDLPPLRGTTSQTGNVMPLEAMEMQQREIARATSQLTTARPQPSVTGPKIDNVRYRSASYVHFSRWTMEMGEEFVGHSDEDLAIRARLISALQMRQSYMEKVKGQFSRTASGFLGRHYPKNLSYAENPKEEEIDQIPYKMEAKPEEPYKWSDVEKYSKEYEIIGRDKGVPIIHLDNKLAFPTFYVSREQFVKDYEMLVNMAYNGPLKTFSLHRMKYLKRKFKNHVAFNNSFELTEQVLIKRMDLHNCWRSDNHIHAGGSLNHRHLLDYIKSKAISDAERVVALDKRGKPLTLSNLLHESGVSDAEDLNMDVLAMHAGKETFDRFDIFNKKYNPIGDPKLREVFMKADNFVKGQYFADLLKNHFRALEKRGTTMEELRISVHGRTFGDWDTLATWAVEHEVFSTHVRFVIQVPRLYEAYRKSKRVNNFDDMLHNLFTPLFEVTNNPSSHKNLNRFLQYVIGFDSVDNEACKESEFTDQSPVPNQWTSQENPPYSYYIYYMYSNLVLLNEFRSERKLNTFALKPHCGESGNFNHLATGFLLADSICHGIQLEESIVLQYLYYLAEIGMAVSPISNNKLFKKVMKSPIPSMFQRGLNISLSTDDPLLFHHAEDPLEEEYSIAENTFGFTKVDLCELARNSILQNGFETKIKKGMLGENFFKPGVEGNEKRLTNVPDIRVAYRHETLIDELLEVFKFYSDS